MVFGFRESLSDMVREQTEKVRLAPWRKPFNINREPDIFHNKENMYGFNIND